MFTESAELYDAIYFQFKDYPGEAADIARRLRAIHPNPRTILDVGCGTGEHARLLTSQYGFEVDGLDVNEEFVRLARLKNPCGRFHEADMTAFALDQRYDAVICMFSSIGYVRTLDRLEQALTCFRKHVAPGGVVLVEPWFPPEAMESGHHSKRTAQIGNLRVERVGTTRIEDRICMLRFDNVVEEGDHIRHATEYHELGLFTERETIAAFAAAGLQAVHEAASSRNRGLYIARAAA